MAPRRLLALTCLVASILLPACGGGDDAPPPPPSDWREVPGMICADGTPTGIAISPGSADAVLVFLMGGGACWSEADCNASTRGPFGRGDYDFLRLLSAGTLFDRTLAGNPFADWTLVFVPYCTGDVHVGDAETTYGATVWRHRGRRNLELAIAALTTALPAPAKVAVTGSSAGGFGSLLAHDLLRSEWPGPATAAYLVNDSGPTLVGDDLPPELRNAWWASWNLATTMAWCTACDNDLSQAWNVLAASHPDDRLAFLSTTRDEVMRGFFGGAAPMDAATFEEAVGALAAKVDALPGANANAFVVGDPATAHAMFFAPGAFSTGGTSLLGWLGQMVGDDPAWTSVGPPFAQAP